MDHKEGWALKNWWFWTVVLEKTLESPLDCKEIKPVHPKGNQPWICIGRSYAEASTLVAWCEELTHWKRPWCWERLKAGGEGDDRGWVGWVVRESIPRVQGSPRREGSGILKEKKRTNIFFSPLHSLVLVNYTTKFKLCTRNYTTTMYPAWGQFLLPEKNLLTNPDILECILWEWVWRIFLLLNSTLVILKCKLLE